MALKKEYMSVNGQVMAERDPSGWEVYTRDALGSVSAISDADRNLVPIGEKPFLCVKSISL